MIDLQVEVRISGGMGSAQDALESVPTEHAKPQTQGDVPSFITSAIHQFEWSFAGGHFAGWTECAIGLRVHALHEGCQRFHPCAKARWADVSEGIAIFGLPANTPCCRSPPKANNGNDPSAHPLRRRLRQLHSVPMSGT